MGVRRHQTISLTFLCPCTKGTTTAQMSDLNLGQLQSGNLKEQCEDAGTSGHFQFKTGWLQIQTSFAL